MSDANQQQDKGQPAPAVDAVTTNFLRILEDHLGTELRLASQPGMWVVVPIDWKANKNSTFWKGVRGAAKVASTPEGAVLDLALAVGHFTATISRKPMAPRHEADTWLATVLSERGTMSAQDVKQCAMQAGLSWATVKAASKRLKVSKVKLGMRGGWQWQLSALVDQTLGASSKVLLAGEEEALPYT
ncbi:MAG: hypothetical protein V4723_03120 [Pseudomonadota bacterium]